MFVVTTIRLDCARADMTRQSELWVTIESNDPSMSVGMMKLRVSGDAFNRIVLDYCGRVVIGLLLLVQDCVDLVDNSPS